MSMSDKLKRMICAELDLIRLKVQDGSVSKFTLNIDKRYEDEGSDYACTVLTFLEEEDDDGSEDDDAYDGSEDDDAYLDTSSIKV